jgi:FixJ family two-component response regulator
MISTETFEFGSRLSGASTPTVFIVDDDISVLESLESLVLSCGWQAETFASAKDFLTRPRGEKSCRAARISHLSLFTLHLSRALSAAATHPCGLEILS